jgi:hypothetical protein
MPPALLRKPLPQPVPASDPRYRRVMDQLKANAKRTATHPPAAKKARDASAAAKGPPTERLAAGKAKQVDKIKDAKESKPEPKSFLETLRAEVAKAMPKELGETEPEKFNEAADQMKGGLKGNVAQQKQASTQDVSGTAKQPPTPTGEAKVETPLPKEGAPPSPEVPGANAMPAPKSDADISLQDSKQNVDAQMTEAEVTPSQMKKANDPRFSAVLTSKDEVAKNADAGPAKYRAAEGPTLRTAAASATSSSRVGAARMLGVHHGSGAKVLTRQQQQKQRDEAKRKEVVDKIESIYTATKERVETKLADLDTQVNNLFDIGVEAALASMTSYVNGKISDYKYDRYLSIPLVGLGRWIRDQFMDLPDEVNVFYEEGRRIFQSKMDKLIVLVATLVELRLKEAKAEVAKGQAEIKAYVESQPKDLQQVAKQAEKNVAERFEELEQSIDDKKNDLARGLAQKYKEAFDKSNEALKAIQEANRGMVSKFAEKLGEVIKALREFKARVMAILQKSEDTIKLIISDPIGFLGNLIDAVKGGITRFVDNIWDHLKAGFLEWLFGNLPPGVEIPKDFELGSILKLVLGVLGITYDKMRAKAVKLIGERNVAIIEKVADYVRTLITGGMSALWEQVKDDLGNLKEMVIDAMQEWLITTLIKKAIAKIVLMFNPVGAIVAAIMAIYDLVMFIVEKAKQILAFVESVINSVADIAAGKIDSAIKKVEDSLARAIPLLIGFLARFLGLSGLADKIREFIFKVQKRVDKAIDKAIAKAVEMIKKTAGAVKEGVKAFLQWWKREKRFTVGSESHRFFFAGNAKNASLKVASDEMSLRDFLAQAKKDNKKKKKVLATIEKIETLQDKIESLRKKREPLEPDAQDPNVDPDINKMFDQIAEQLPALFSGTEWGTQTNPVLILDYPKKAATLYRTLYLGPLVKGKLSQAVLKEAYDDQSKRKGKGAGPVDPIEPKKSELEQWVNDGGRVREYRPFDKQDWPDHKPHGEQKLGVDEQFLAQPGTLFRYDPGKTPGGRKLNDQLKKFGYYGKADGGENSDGDHILEAQLIGKKSADVLGNMWPLDKHENRHGQNLRTKAPAEVGEGELEFSNLEAVMNSTEKHKTKAKEIYIMIKRTKS